MITRVDRATTFGRIHETGVRARTQRSNSFTNLLSDPATNRGDSVSLRANTAEAVNALSVTKTADRQEIATRAVASAPAAASTNKAAPATLNCWGGTEFTDTATALSQLTEALKEAGIDPATLGLYGHDEMQYFPAGDYKLHLIDVTVGGRTEHLLANLVSLAPKVAVTEIKNMLGRV